MATGVLEPIRARVSRVRAFEVLVVVNSHASGVRPELVAGIEEQLARWGASSRILITESAGEWVDELNGDADRRLVFLGGDGTLHAAANMSGPRPELALIPAGRGNNVARSLGIPLAPGAAARLAVEGRAKPIDLIEAVTPSQRYLTVEGVSAGFLSQARSHYREANSAHVAAAAVAAAHAVAEFHPFRLRVTHDGSSEELALAQLFVANLPLYGFGLYVAPGADATDGLLEIVAIEGRGRLDLLPMILRLRQATELDHFEAHHWRARRVRIQSHGVLPVIADTVELENGPVDLTVLPGELPLVRP